MLNIPLPIYVAFFFFLGSMLLLELHMRYRRKQESLPLLDEFLSNHALQKPVCNECGSEHMHEIGFLHSDDPKRIVSCGQCKTLLYRYECTELAAKEAQEAA
ncbi:MAG TPA: hypothetical protein PLN31_10635 [Azoarcus taiwanensis]|nr:hypothetical protein [Azoarcus taiwanensis]